MMNKIEAFVEKVKKNKFLLFVLIGTVGVVGFLFMKKILAGGGGPASGSASGGSGSMIYSPTAGGSTDTGSYGGTAGEQVTQNPVGSLKDLFDQTNQVNNIIANANRNLIDTGKNAETLNTGKTAMSRIYDIQSQISTLKNQYAKAETEADRQRIHNQANSLRGSALAIANNEGLSTSNVNVGEDYTELKVNGIQL